jgi:Holliday junction DNA helicase RuvA
VFNSIAGTITGKEAGLLFITTGGVEWEITLSSRDLDALPPVGEQGRVWTWLSHRENEMRLYGFASPENRELFLQLITVEGIGPKGAQRIMGGIDADALLDAIDRDDLSTLQTVPGLGKKTAQKLLLALQGKAIRRGAPQSALKKPANADLIEALVRMGYDRKAASEALEAASLELSSSETGGAERENQLFRLAIVRLSS